MKYYGLRDYKTGTWEGGDPKCSHTKDRSIGVASSTLQGGKATTNHQHEAAYRDTCICGAIRRDQQLGLELTLDAFLARLVAVFDEVRRVLHPSGVAFVDMGSSYCSNPMQVNESFLIRDDLTPDELAHVLSTLASLVKSGEIARPEISVHVDP